MKSKLLIVLTMLVLFSQLVFSPFIPNGEAQSSQGSIVGTSTTSFATSYSFQRKCFYANGRFWVFYSDGSNIVYCTSTDGVNWSSATTVRSCPYGYRFSVWFDGTYMHYAYAASSSIYYRRGTPNSDGTITWSANEQTVSTTYNKANCPFVSVDSNGYVWIGYIDYTGSYYYPYVIRSGNNNGTWGTTPNGFPYQLSTTTSASWSVSVVPLTNGKMLVVYAYSNAVVRACCWNGDSWNTEVTTTSLCRSGYSISVVAEGDDADIVFLKSSVYDILHVKYTYSTNSLSSEHTVIAGATSTSAPVLCRDYTSDTLYVFWATITSGSPSGAVANHIYYQTSTDDGATWSSPVDWIDESSEALYSADRLTCFYQAFNGYVGLLYLTKTASPYNVKFAYLTLAAPPTQEYTFTFSETINSNAIFSFGKEIFHKPVESASVCTSTSLGVETVFVFHEMSTLPHSLKLFREMLFSLSETVTSTSTLNWMKEIVMLEIEVAVMETIETLSIIQFYKETLFSTIQTLQVSSNSFWGKELWFLNVEIAPATSNLWYFKEALFHITETPVPAVTTLIIKEALVTFFEFLETINPTATFTHLIEQTQIALPWFYDLKMVFAVGTVIVTSIIFFLKLQK